MSKSIHFIAIGGSVMHALAIAMKEKGHHVTGSDDAIYGVSRDNLDHAGLLPEEAGWHPEKIHSGIDSVVLGMHARKDNPELAKALELDIPIQSFPELIYELCSEKQRIVIAGSHGKTTTSAMLIHLLDTLNIPCDYMLGAPPSPGAPLARLSHAKLVVIEGDEYLSSPLDLRPKFIHYHHDIGLVNGIAWDHANVFPDKDKYTELFYEFADLTSKDGYLVYNEEDPMVRSLGQSRVSKTNTVGFSILAHTIETGITHLLNDGERFPLHIMGKHNLNNMAGAKAIADIIGVSSKDFFSAMTSFGGAKRRMELISSSRHHTLYFDFAHSPSKVSATVKALSDQFPEDDLIAFLELHTFSSLNKSFLPEYQGALKKAYTGIVYYDPKVVENKGLPPIEEREIIEFFDQDIQVFTDKDQILTYLHELKKERDVRTHYLFMSSGNFGGLDVEGTVSKLLEE